MIRNQKQLNLCLIIIIIIDHEPLNFYLNTQVPKNMTKLDGGNACRHSATVLEGTFDR